MIIKKATAAAAAILMAAMLTVPASAMTELEPTDVAHKFDLGSDANGGSGVEDENRNWIKVIQPYNAAKLFNEVYDPDAIAVAVTFEISEWSGVEFNVGWGGLLTFYSGDGNWFGYEDFQGISDYVINSEGEYTVVCDLDKLVKAQGEEGLEELLALEMVIDGVEEGDPTNIEVKSARVYFVGDEVESPVLPAAEVSSDSSSKAAEEESSNAAEESSKAAEESSAKADDSSTKETVTAANNSTTATATANNTTAATGGAAAADTSDDSSTAQTGLTEGLVFAGIVLAGSAVVIANAKRKK